MSVDLESGSDTMITEDYSESRRFLLPDAAAAYVRATGIPMTRSHLAKLRVVGGGPNFRKAGRHVLYEPTALDQWIDQRVGPAQQHTSHK